MTIRMIFNHKRITLISLVLLFLLVITACTNDNSTEENSGDSIENTDAITFTAWGGSTQEAQEEAWGVPFTEETGITVNTDNTDFGKLKAMVESGNVTWDVVDLTEQGAHVAIEEGLVEELDFSIIDKSDLDPDFTNDHFVGSFSYSFVSAYNKDIIDAEPTEGWKSFFDTTKFDSRTMYQDMIDGAVFEQALLADGVDPEDLYPIDLDRAFAKLDEIKSSTVWWDSGAKSQQLLTSGEVDLSSMWNGRVFPLVEEGSNIGIDWTNNLKMGDVLVVPKGSKNKEAAMKFIDIATSAKPEAEFTNETGFDPMNENALEYIDEEIKPYLSSQHEDSQIVVDSEYWAEVKDEVQPKIDAWLIE